MKPGMRPIGSEAEAVHNITVKPRAGQGFEIMPNPKMLDDLAPCGNEAAGLEPKRKIKLQLETTTPWPDLEQVHKAYAQHFQSGPNSHNAVQSAILIPGYPPVPASLAQSFFAPFFHPGFPTMHTEPVEGVAWDRRRTNRRPRIQEIESDAEVLQSTTIKPSTRQGFKTVPKQRSQTTDSVESFETEAADWESHKKVKLRLKRSAKRFKSRQLQKAYVQQFHSRSSSDNVMQSTIVTPWYPALPAGLAQPLFAPYFHPGFPAMRTRPLLKLM